MSERLNNDIKPIWDNPKPPSIESRMRKIEAVVKDILNKDLAMLSSGLEHAIQGPLWETEKSLEDINNKLHFVPQKSNIIEESKTARESLKLDINPRFANLQNVITRKVDALLQST